MISFTIATFLKSYEDPFVLQEVQEIIHVLAENEFCIMTLQERLVPTLVSLKNLQISTKKCHLIDFIGLKLGEHLKFGK